MQTQHLFRVNGVVKPLLLNFNPLKPSVEFGLLWIRNMLHASSDFMSIPTNSPHDKFVGRDHQNIKLNTLVIRHSVVNLHTNYPIRY